MTKISKYADTVQAYNSAIENVSANIQQDRSLHMSDLCNVYMEAALTQAPDGIMTMMEEIISDRSDFSDRKLVLDAAELTMHEQKLAKSLKQNTGVLSGGSRDIVISDHEAKKAMAYAAERSNALLYNMYKKISHDRSIHQQELNNIYFESLKVAGPNQFTSMLENMIEDRKVFNSRKMALDAGLWAQTENFVKDNIGRSVLKAGADGKIRGGKRSLKLKPMKLDVGGQSFDVPPPKKPSKKGFFMTCGKKNERFENAQAAEMWRTLMNSRDTTCGQVTQRR